MLKNYGLRAGLSLALFSKRTPVPTHRLSVFPDCLHHLVGLQTALDGNCLLDQAVEELSATSLKV